MYGYLHNVANPIFVFYFTELTVTGNVTSFQSLYHTIKKQQFLMILHGKMKMYFFI